MFYHHTEVKGTKEDNFKYVVLHLLKRGGGGIYINKAHLLNVKLHFWLQKLNTQKKLSLETFQLMNQKWPLPNSW